MMLNDETLCGLPEPPDLWEAARGALMILVITAALVGIVSLFTGCGGTSVVVTHVEGAGSIDFLVDGQPYAVEFSEEGERVGDELVHCSVVDRIIIHGLSVASGTVPPPFSDERCFTNAGHRPFRLGGSEVGVTGGRAVERSGAGASADSP